MKLNEIIKWTNGRVYSPKKLNKKIKDISIDTRTLKKGDLFIALSGKNGDGHEFIDKAINKGAVAVLSERKIDNNKDVPIIIVENTYDSLLNIASNMRDKYKNKVIAITGSVGKTMTKELIASCLEAKYKVLKSEGSFNNHIGLPLTIFKLNNSYDYLVVELGTNHIGEIEKLSKIAQPDIAVITNIGTSHIGNFKNIKNIVKEKKSIYKDMQNGIVVVNGDNKYLKKIKSKVNNIHYSGIELNNELIAYDIIEELTKTKFKIKINNEEHEITINVPGKHFVNNVLLAMKVALLNAVEIEDIKTAIFNYKPLINRMNIIDGSDNNKIISDCYNSSYESLMGVIDYVDMIPSDKLLIIGDILELGKHSKKYHIKIIQRLKKINNAEVILIGENLTKVKSPFKKFTNNNEILDYLISKQIKNTIILIKGSRKLKLEEVREYFEKL